MRTSHSEALISKCTDWGVYRFFSQYLQIYLMYTVSWIVHVERMDCGLQFVGEFVCLKVCGAGRFTQVAF